MNRRARRQAVRELAGSAPANDAFADQTGSYFYEKAILHYRRGDLPQAEILCRSALNRDPRHLRALALLGDIAQQSGRNKLAVKLLQQALEIDCTDATAHDSLAIACQALGRMSDAERHFTDAIALGLNEPEALVRRCPAIAPLLHRLATTWPRQLGLTELLGDAGAGPLGREPMLLALLQTRPIHDLELERLLTALRGGLLGQIIQNPDFDCDADALAFFCALASQCFINEYVFALIDREREALQTVQARLACAISTGAAIAPLILIGVASYLPLHTLPMAELLLKGTHPAPLARLLERQIQEPIEEASDRAHIPALTRIDDCITLQVKKQYEENPYPRWSAVAPVRSTTVANFLWDNLGISPQGWPRTRYGAEILIAGCGTGSHSVDTALRFPRARLLAVDISGASLAFARRASRALALTNIEYGQADILELGASERRFDVIETVGVLHHLSDPAAGWRSLLSLLRPNGLMFVGLYSDTGRQSLEVARALIAKHGYRPVPDDIRACRQELIRHGWVPQFRDFSSTSGCRDLLFNVMEHRFDIPAIGTFLQTHGLRFLGFEQLPRGASEQFAQQHPGHASDCDLAAWHSFEQQHPQTFSNMYLFWVQKTQSH